MQRQRRRREKSTSPPRTAGAPAAATLATAPHAGYALYTKLLPFAQLAAVVGACVQCFRIRLWAVTTYGPIIHEFDPWFNYRATKYLVDHGWQAFSTWFDYESWYPLGRPVGAPSTGLMVTARRRSARPRRLGLGGLSMIFCTSLPHSRSCHASVSTASRTRSRRRGVPPHWPAA